MPDSLRCAGKCCLALRGGFPLPPGRKWKRPPTRTWLGFSTFHPPKQLCSCLYGRRSSAKGFWHEEDGQAEGKVLPLRDSSVCYAPMCRKTRPFSAFSAFFPERKTCGWKRGFQRFWPFFLNVVLTVSACQGPFGMARTHSLLQGSWLVGTPLDGPWPVLATITGNGAYCLKVVPLRWRMGRLAWPPVWLVVFPKSIYASCPPRWAGRAGPGVCSLVTAWPCTLRCLSFA